MRRYFVFGLKGSHFTTEVSVASSWNNKAVAYLDRQVWLILHRASQGLGNVAPSQMRLLSWREE